MKRQDSSATPETEPEAVAPEPEPINVEPRKKKAMETPPSATDNMAKAGRVMAGTGVALGGAWMVAFALTVFVPGAQVVLPFLLAATAVSTGLGVATIFAAGMAKLVGKIGEGIKSLFDSSKEPTPEVEQQREQQRGQGKQQEAEQTKGIGQTEGKENSIMSGQERFALKLMERANSLIETALKKHRGESVDTSDKGSPEMLYAKAKAFAEAARKVSVAQPTPEFTAKFNKVTKSYADQKAEVKDTQKSSNPLHSVRLASGADGGVANEISQIREQVRREIVAESAREARVGGALQGAQSGGKVNSVGPPETNRSSQQAQNQGNVRG